jgi:hypothetical protein
MRIDTAISKKKYEKEIRLLLENTAEWRKRGCFFLQHSFPYIDALFVPKNSLLIIPGVSISGQNGLQPLMVARNDVTGRTFGARIDMTDYDVIAPSVKFFDAHNWEPATLENLPKAMFIPPDGGQHFNILHNHLITGAPFLCLEGIREFYDHPQHDNENWFINRAGFGLHYIIDSICRTFCEYTVPVFQLNNSWLPAATRGQNGTP